MGPACQVRLKEKEKEKGLRCNGLKGKRSDSARPSNLAQIGLVLGLARAAASQAILRAVPTGRRQPTLPLLSFFFPFSSSPSIDNSGPLVAAQAGAASSRRGAEQIDGGEVFVGPSFRRSRRRGFQAATARRGGLRGQGPSVSGRRCGQRAQQEGSWRGRLVRCVRGRNVPGIGMVMCGVPVHKCARVRRRGCASARRGPRHGWVHVVEEQRAQQV